MQIVFPRWVTQIAAGMFAVGALITQLHQQILEVVGPLGVLLPKGLSTAVMIVGAVLGILGKALMDSDGDGKPDGLTARRSGHARAGLLPILTLLGACGLIGAGSGGGTRVPPTASPDRVTTAIAAVQATVTFSGGCGLDTTASTCRWEIERNGVSVGPVAEGRTFSVVGARPVAGDSVVYRVRMKWVNPVGAASPDWTGWLSRTHVEPFPVPPVPTTDSIVSVVITVQP